MLLINLHYCKQLLPTMTTMTFWLIICALIGCIRCEMMDWTNLSAEAIKSHLNPQNDPLISLEVMNEIMGGTFLMGTDAPDANHGENPSRTINVRTFHLDRYPVTISHFKNFLLRKKRYKPQCILNGYSYVTKGLEAKYVDRNCVEPHPENDLYNRVPDASWKYPEGKGSALDDRLFHPVTHVSYEDAQAYCLWKKKRLPTEAEWEFASRGGLQEKKFPWGGKFKTNRSNLWQGEYPNGGKAEDGFNMTSPVNQFPAQNSYGLFDMLGNVWEWTNAVFKDRERKRRVDAPRLFVMKGASFVDTVKVDQPNHLARVTARMGAEAKFTANNVGFRCALSNEQAHALQVRVLPDHVEL
ncbi:inactive C-alpha-formylglycine-generating enzyme 2-like isoform X2 [Symsagittifera roscoffensis]|uniref:inactive C-alpha-formylglycine-generating enzyme 2-like isoform X2 n=1 Tax=Symsagittifera roscoffensis TaxID=84072 RepID=UPI00307C1FA5